MKTSLPPSLSLHGASSCSSPLIGPEPCPSLLLQRHMAALLSSDKDMGASFLNSVLNQLNWAFSEFIGMIQEVGGAASPAPHQHQLHLQHPHICSSCSCSSSPQIQQAAERPERNFVDTRQLKVTAHLLHSDSAHFLLMFTSCPE